MKVNDWKLLGLIASILGVFFFVGTILSYFVPSLVEQGYGTLHYYYDFRDYSLGLGIAGSVLLTVGLGFLWRARAERN